MNAKTFDSLLAVRMQLSKDTLAFKAEEYSSNTDRKHNFHVAAAMLGCSAEEALFGMMTKHLVSTLDLAKFKPKSPEELKTESYIREKCGDAINYMILLEALLLERHGHIDGGSNASAI